MIKSLLGQRILCRKSRKYHKRGGKGFIQQQKEESKSNQKVIKPPVELVIHDCEVN